MSTELSMMVGRLPAAEGVELIVASRFRYDPLTTTTAPIFKAVPKVSSRVKYKASFIRKASYNARPVDSVCDNSNFGTGNKEGIVSREFSGVLYDYSGELCPDDFAEVCQAWANSSIYRMLNPTGEFQRNELLQVIFGLKYETMLDDIVRIAWYSKAGAFAVNTAAGSAPFYIGSVPAGADKMLGGKQSGVWDLAATNVGAGLTTYVDTNDNTVAGNILNPANIYSILQRFINSASAELRGVAKGTANSPFFLVDSSVFEALRDYYTMNGVNTNHVAAWDMQMQAQEVLMFQGYRVYRDNNADKFDTEIGAKTTSTIAGKLVTHSRNCRVLFTVPNNIYLGLDLETPSGDTIGLIVAPAADQVRDAGKIFWKMLTSVGILIAEPEMMVVGYPSVATAFQ
jgi:hypothetical protein